MHSCSIKRVSSSVIQTMRGVGLLTLCVGLSLATIAAMRPWVSEGPDSILTTSTSASTSSRALRSSGQSSYMSLPDTGRPGSAQATLTRQHCPHCDKFLLAKSMVRHINTQH